MNLSELAHWSTEKHYAFWGDKRTPMYETIIWIECKALALQAYLVRE